MAGASNGKWQVLKAFWEKMNLKMKMKMKEAVKDVSEVSLTNYVQAASAILAVNAAVDQVLNPSASAEQLTEVEKKLREDVDDIIWAVDRKAKESTVRTVAALTVPTPSMIGSSLTGFFLRRADVPHVIIPVSSVSQALYFYISAFGAKIVSYDGGDAKIQLGGRMMSIVSRTRPAVDSRFTLECQDVGATVRDAVGAGAVVLDTAEDGTRVRVLDPCGLTWDIISV